MVLGVVTDVVMGARSGEEELVVGGYGTETDTMWSAIQTGTRCNISNRFLVTGVVATPTCPSDVMGGLGTTSPLGY